jgi:F0F1-type ATP synthase beta subunit
MILDGECDEMAKNDLYMIGSLDSASENANA